MISIRILGRVFIFTSWVLGVAYADERKESNAAQAEARSEMPRPYMYKYINDSLSAVGERPLSVLPPLPAPVICYRVIICGSGRPIGETERLLILSVAGRAGFESVADDLIWHMDMDVEAQEIAIGGDGHAVVVQKKRMKMTEKAAEDWFDMLWRTELFSLPPDPVKDKDQGVFRAGVGNEIWVFERHNYSGYKVMVRGSYYGGSSKIVRDYAVGMIESLFAQHEKAVPKQATPSPPPPPTNTTPPATSPTASPPPARPGTPTTKS